MKELEFDQTGKYEILSLTTECRNIKSLPMCVIYPRDEERT
jgi:hypothetical protein